MNLRAPPGKAGVFYLGNLIKKHVAPIAASSYLETTKRAAQTGVDRQKLGHQATALGLT